MKFKSKKASTQDVSIWLLLALLVATFIVIIFLRKAGGITKLSECESYGGVLILEGESCNNNVSTHFVPGDDKNGNICCRKKSIVTAEEFTTWSATTKKPISTSTSSSGIPVVSTSGTQERILNEPPKTGTISGVKLAGLKEGELRLAFNANEQKSADSKNMNQFIVTQNTPFVISALHNNKKGTYCKLYVVKADISGEGFSAQRNERGQIISLPGMSFSESNCAPSEEGLAQLQIENEISEVGYYKADYIVKESSNGVTLSSRSILFYVKEGTPQEVTENAIPIPPTITIDYTQDSRGNKIYCWVDVGRVTYGQKLDTDLEVYAGKSSISCNDANYVRVNLGESASVAPDKYYCIRAEQKYKDEIGVERVRVERESITLNQCDEVTFKAIETNDNTQLITFVQCSQTCEEIKELKSCLYMSRGNDCKYSIDCYTTAGLLKKGTCTTCDENVISCAGYRNKESCEANECLQDQRCQWNDKFPVGKCVAYDITLNTK